MSRSRCLAAACVSALMLVGVFSGVSAASKTTTTKTSTTTTQASNTPTGGAIQLIVQPSLSQQGGGKVIITGAIGDYGTGQKLKTSKGTYNRVNLTKGTFEVDLTAINKKVNAANPTLNTATCSAEISETAPVSLLDGTGLYKGISGSVTLTETLAFIGGRYTSGKHKGQCNENVTVAQMGTVYGTGSVSFS